ncbi:hypothetical protein D3C78_1353240 [compost metagenome]
MAFTSARVKRVFWKSRIDLPKALRSRVYSTVKASARSSEAAAWIEISARS